MTEFTPIASLFGGALIGLAAVLLMAIHGRIAGISGISVSVLPPWAGQMARGEIGWRLAFIAGVIAAPLAYHLVAGQAVQQTVSTNVSLMVIAGLITGFGSVYGNGCTSGHGVCGMSRLSVRSIIATVIYIGAGVLVIIAARGMGVL